MVKQSAWSKNNRRELKKTLGRFLSIAAIVALGVSMFTGLRTARPAMVQTCNEYLEQTNFYDLQLLSSVAFDLDSPADYAAIPGVLAAEGSVSADLLARIDQEELVFKTHLLLSELNQVQLTAGRMPQSADEVLADDLAFTSQDLGSTLTVLHQDDSVFSQDTYTIVGLCTSPMYLNLSRGTTSLGRGSVSGFLFLTEGGYDIDYWTELYLRVERETQDRFTSSYQDELDPWEDVLLPKIQAQSSNRADRLYLQARQELGNGWQEYYDGLIQYETGKADAEQQLDDAWQKLQNAKVQLEDGERQLEDGAEQLAQLKENPYSIPELAAARSQLDDGRQQLEEGRAEYEEGLAQYKAMELPIRLAITAAQDGLSAAQQQLDQAKAAYDQAQQTWNETEAELRNQLETLYAPVAQTEEALAVAQADLAQKETDLAELKAANASASEIAQAQMAVEAAQMQVQTSQAAYDTAKTVYDLEAAAINRQLETAAQTLAAAKSALEHSQSAVDQLNATISDGTQQLQDAKSQLLEAEIQLEQGQKELDEGEATLEQSIADAIAQAETQLQDGQTQLFDAKQQYADGLLDYETGKAKAEEELDQAEKELRSALRTLQEAELELDRMQHSSCYVMTPASNNGFASFDNDTSIVAAIANVFPLFFLLVAALVCSSTMSRMVEEQRTQNGTLKALGYSDLRIMSRYAAYAGLAALAGTAVGLLLGTYLFPYVIWVAYQMLYHFSPLDFLFVWSDALIALAAALICCCGAACLAAWSDLRLMPAQLMRPKAPKAGKRIFLERITPLWNSLSFLSKVSLRNIFRYRKRLIMMLLGTGGCLALLLTGLGLRDSIANVADDQFDVITKYDYAVTFSDALTQKEQQQFRTEFSQQLTRCAFAGTQTLDVPTSHGSKSVIFVASSDPTMEEILGLYWQGEDLGYPTGDGLYISHALAQDAGLSVGDTLPVRLDSQDLLEIPITGIFTNYVSHYAYLTQEGYTKWFGIEPEIKTVFATTDQDLYELGAALQQYDGVLNVTIVQDTKDSVAQAISSMNAIILLVVICAAALAFVVGYNLININITERAREIATLKVLGFYQKETHDYVFRETILLTLMGTVVGIPLGIWLHRYVMQAVKVDFVCFQIQISPLSYTLAISLTIVVTWIVDRILSKKIDAIHMADSLKSVE